MSGERGRGGVSHGMPRQNDWPHRPARWPHRGTMLRWLSMLGPGQPLPVLSFCCTPLRALAGVSMGIESGCHHFDSTGMPSRPGPVPTKLYPKSFAPWVCRNRTRVRRPPAAAAQDIPVLLFCRHPLSVPVETPSKVRGGCAAERQATALASCITTRQKS